MVALLYNTKTESISVSSTSAGDNADVLYTCPLNHDCSIDMLFITNSSGSSGKVSIQFYHNDDSQYHHFLVEYNMDGNDGINILGSGQFHLHAGDKIVCYKESGKTFDVTMSGREYYNPARPS